MMRGMMTMQICGSNTTTITITATAITTNNSHLGFEKKNVCGCKYTTKSIVMMSCSHTFTATPLVFFTLCRDLPYALRHCPTPSEPQSADPLERCGGW